MLMLAIRIRLCDENGNVKLDCPDIGKNFAAEEISAIGQKLQLWGSGPADLFASLVLAEFGVDVTLMERGQPVEKRGYDIGALVVRLAYSFYFLLGCTSHNSMIYSVDQIGPPLAQSVLLRDLPLHDIMFVSEKLVIGVSFDCNHMVFAADGTGFWSFVRYLDEKSIF
ncbi:putative FAD dependent protein [Helianthus debilis subsp. tardiflorus]